MLPAVPLAASAIFEPRPTTEGITGDGSGCGFVTGEEEVYDICVRERIVDIPASFWQTNSLHDLVILIQLELLARLTIEKRQNGQLEVIPHSLRMNGPLCRLAPPSPYTVDLT